jgi:hypothetical protein
MFKECDTEMVKYANNNSSVLAILSKDSDFLIYPGKWRYFSLEDVDLETLETKEFNRNALRNHLKLTDFELNVLATLNGNDVISYDDTKRFHYYLVGRAHFSERFKSLADYIKTLPINNKVALTQKVAQCLFNNTSSSYVDKVLQSFDIYSLVN